MQQCSFSRPGSGYSSGSHRACGRIAWPQIRFASSWAGPKSLRPALGWRLCVRRPCGCPFLLRSAYSGFRLLRVPVCLPGTMAAPSAFAPLSRRFRFPLRLPPSRLTGVRRRGASSLQRRLRDRQCGLRFLAGHADAHCAPKCRRAVRIK